MAKIKNVPVQVAASILGKAAQVIRCGLVYGKLPFGVAVKMNPKQKSHTYHISVELFKKYAGCTDADIIRHAEKCGCELKLDEE